MDLKTYLKQLDKDERHKLALAVNTTLGQLQNISYGYRTCAPALAVAIERNTAKAVTRQELLPDEWLGIWPELATSQSTAEQGA